MRMKPIKKSELALFLRQLLFLDRIEKKINQREKKQYAEILEENTKSYLKIENEWN